MNKLEQCWQAHYEEITKFIENNHRNPSKHRAEDMKMVNWLKQQRKLRNKGLLPEGRKERFNQLMALIDQYHRLNQYG